MTSAAAWSNDLLGRKLDAVFLIDFIIRKLNERERRGEKRCFVLNIDAGWGQGKSYFLENLKATLEEMQHVVAYVNAWNDDHADDPLIAVMSAIETAVSKASTTKTKKPLSKFTQIGGQVAAAAAKGLVKQTINRYAGEDTLKEISELLGSAGSEAVKSAADEAAKTISDIYDKEGKLLLEKFRLGQKTIHAFKKQTGELLSSFQSGYKKPLFILVDELDRCRPPYAVALLERVKHLFDVDDVVFIMATDTEQLRHSIGALYGANFDAARYLLRFFDQTYRFENATIDEFVNHQFSDIDQSKLFGSPQLSPVEFAARAFKAFHLSLRDIEQCADILRNCVTVWSSPSKIVLLVLLPLVILQQQRLEVGYNEIGDRLADRLGPISWNRLDFDVFEERERRKKLFDGLALLRHFIGRVTAYNLFQILNDDDDKSPDSKAVRNTLGAEANARFPSGYPMNDPPVSLIREYPILVRSVGRLTPS